MVEVGARVPRSSHLLLGCIESNEEQLRICIGMSRKDCKMYTMVYRQELSYNLWWKGIITEQ